MAQFSIVGLSYMTSGQSRGLLGVELRPVKMPGKDIFLLDREFESGEIDPVLSGQGIITESGGYAVNRTRYLETSGPGAVRVSAVTNVLLDETQTEIDVESLSGSFGYSRQMTPQQIEAMAANPPSALRLFPSADSAGISELSDYERYQEACSSVTAVFVFEKGGASEENGNLKTICRAEDGGGWQVKPLYDILDMSVKESAGKGLYGDMTNSVNASVPPHVGQGREENTNDTVDAYLPLTRNPLGLCQVGENAMVLTDLTVKRPYYLKSDAGARLSAWTFTGTYSFALEQDDAEVFLYRDLSSYGLSSYGQYIASNAVRPEDCWLTSVFQVGRRIRGIGRNYLLELDQSTPRGSHTYEGGNVHAGILACKNPYNALYSMEMPDVSSIAECREYCGVQNAAGEVVLKYYDTASYGIGLSGDTAAHRLPGDGKLPYQKVEYLYKVDSNSNVYHKSNLFSVRLTDTGLDSRTDTGGVGLKQKMRRDITNSIKQLAESICPANTQLFDVYFQDRWVS